MSAGSGVFADHGVLNLRAIVDAESANVNDASQAYEAGCFQDIDCPQNIIGGAGVGVFGNPFADEAGGVHDGVSVKFIERLDQCGQVAHVCRDDVCLVGPNDFPDVVSVRHEIIKDHLVSAIDESSREVGTDETGTSNQNVHGKSSE